MSSTYTAEREVWTLTVREPQDVKTFVGASATESLEKAREHYGYDDGTPRWMRGDNQFLEWLTHEEHYGTVSQMNLVKFED